MNHTRQLPNPAALAPRTALTPAAQWLTERLTRRAPQLGVFLPAGFPGPQTDVVALRLFAFRGAGILEIGIPHTHPVLDGPLIASAYQQALRRGFQIADVLETVRQAATTTWASVVVMSYWAPIRAYGVERFARNLALAGAAGAMIVDLPVDKAGPWLRAARHSGLHTPQLVSRRASDEDLRQVGSAATGWLYAPAADALTGYTGHLNVPSLNEFTQRLHHVSHAPVVTGIGISTPQRASEIRQLVSGVVIGTPIVRPLLEQAGSSALRTAADHVAAFADALNAPLSRAAEELERPCVPSNPQARRLKQSLWPGGRAE